jgi:glyoxylase-like metal-dependent hydrolase (beta-lactamase superfamily II)
MKIEKDLYAYIWQDPYENNCNSYVIRGEVTALIDPGHSHHVPNLLQQMESDGISPDEINIVLLTHCHPDHFEGLEAFLDKPVKIAMNQEEEKYLLERGKALFEMMGQSLPKFRVDFYLKEGELRLGDKTFNIYVTPGHSPGSLSIYWPDRKVLLTGDLIFSGSIGRTDFPGGNSKLIKKSIERMSQLDIDLLLPGHMDVVTGRESVLQNFEFIRQNFYAYL